MDERIKASRAQEKRILARVEVDPESGCWVWTGCVTTGGYGTVSICNRTVYVHRWSYEHFVGPILSGFDVDHTCHNESECLGGKACLHRRCLNPDHLRPKTRSANLLSASRNLGRSQKTRTHCPQGHAYDAENTYVSRGKRYCRACRKLRRREAAHG